MDTQMWKNQISDNLKKAIVTGITKIAKAGLFSDINNVVDYSILEPKYCSKSSIV